MRIRYDHTRHGIWVFSNALYRLTGTIRTRWFFYAFWIGYGVAVLVVGWWILEGFMGWVE